MTYNVSSGTLSFYTTTTISPTFVVFKAVESFSEDKSDVAALVDYYICDC